MYLIKKHKLNIYKYIYILKIFLCTLTENRVWNEKILFYIFDIFVYIISILYEIISSFCFLYHQKHCAYNKIIKFNEISYLIINNIIYNIN